MLLGFDDPDKKSLENNAGKGENGGNHHFPPFLTMFSILKLTKNHPLNLSQTTNFRLFHTERVCRQHEI